MHRNRFVVTLPQRLCVGMAEGLDGKCPLHKKAADSLQQIHQELVGNCPPPFSLTYRVTRKIYTLNSLAKVVLTAPALGMTMLDRYINRKISLRNIGPMLWAMLKFVKSSI